MVKSFSEMEHTVLIQLLSTKMHFQNLMVWSIEEISELIQVICKYLRNNRKFDIDNLREELSDVYLAACLIEYRITNTETCIEIKFKSVDIIGLPNFLSSLNNAALDLSYNLEMRSESEKINIISLVEAVNFMKSSVEKLILKYFNEITMENIYEDMRKTMQDKLEKIRRKETSDDKMSDPY